MNYLAIINNCIAYTHRKKLDQPLLHIYHRNKTYFFPFMNINFIKIMIMYLINIHIDFCVSPFKSFSVLYHINQYYYFILRYIYENSSQTKQNDKTWLLFSRTIHTRLIPFIIVNFLFFSLVSL